MKLHPRLSAESVVLARRGERLRPEAERDARGWVVGYGHRASAREGARVSEDDATTLLVYDLSQSAGRVEPLLERPTPPAMFDALNAYAWRVGPQGFANSDVLRRWNAGEPLTPAEVLAARDAADAGPWADAPSAVLAAADAVRDRLSQVLDAPSEPPPPRAPREPWPDPPPHATAFPPPGDRQPAVQKPTTPLELAPLDVDAQDAAPVEQPENDEPPPPPFIAAPVAPPGSPIRAPEPPAEPPAYDHDIPESPAAAHPASQHAPRAPVVSFVQGGRARIWERLRGDPRVYMGVGACGLLLFLCALVGAAVGRPTPMGVAVGLVGVLCLAPSIAFFLHRRAPRR